MKGGIKREDIFVTSKLWNAYHRPELVSKALETTLNVIYIYIKLKRKLKYI